jgi:hypothetical protein
MQSLNSSLNSMAMEQANRRGLTLSRLRVSQGRQSTCLAQADRGAMRIGLMLVCVDWTGACIAAGAAREICGHNGRPTTQGIRMPYDDVENVRSDTPFRK